MNSAIADPVHRETIKVSKSNPNITLRGYAVGNQLKGTPVDKVEVSFDSGKTWTKANITLREEKDPSKRVFSWVLWEYQINALNYIESATG